MKRCMFTIGAAVAAALVQAAVSVETFEADAGTWTGGTLTAGEPATAPANGYAVTGATHEQVFSVDSKASRSAVTSGTVSCDLLVRIAQSAQTPTAAEIFDEHLAIVADTDGRLLAFTNATGSAVVVDSTARANGDWVRLTTLFDCPNNRCRIAVNGELACGGAWLPIALSSLSGIDVKGETAIDDVVIQDKASTVYDKYAAVTTTGEAATVTVGDIAVPTNYLTVNRKEATVEAAGASIAHSSPTMTVAQAYQVGVAPVVGATFAITAAEPTADGIVLTFPGSWPADSYEVKYGSTAACAEGTVGAASFVKADGVNKATIPLPESGVLYYKVGR